MYEVTVKLQIDTYWVEVGKSSAVDVLRRYGDRVVSIHLKDGPINLDDNQHVATPAPTSSIHYATASRTFEVGDERHEAKSLRFRDL